DRRHACILEASRDVERGKLRRLGPALDRDLAVASVEANRNARGKFARRRLHERRIANRRRADDHAVDALAEPGFHGRHVAYPAAQLHRARDRFQDALDRRGINRLAREGAVEVDDVKILEALRLKALRLRGRIAIENRRARHVALFQSNRDSVLEVNGGEKDQGFHFRKLAIRCNPRRWLFSGWNWVPATVSRPTIAVTGPP